ncbi:MAG: hypothetical protein Q7R69_02080 [bacterium]|nr:hypothetical protein [bacterium]
MDPKFQSSFIPKGPFAAPVPGVSMGPKTKDTSLLAVLALAVFIVSIVAAAGVFGYKFYLKYSIDQMGVALEAARATLSPGTIRELTRLDNRIISTKDLIAAHSILTPLFEFLEVSTPKTVRFNDFSYVRTEQGLEFTLRGEARGYAALAFLADMFSKSQYFKNAIFSDLNLNAKGDVNFSFKAVVDSSLVSYKREVERLGAPVIVPTAGPTATSTATST